MFFCLLDVTIYHTSTLINIVIFSDRLGDSVVSGFGTKESQNMGQCLRCSKPCEATSLFCETCKAHLRSQLWQKSDTNVLMGESAQITPFVAISPDHGGVSGDPLERITGPQPVVGTAQFSQASHPPQMLPTPRISRSSDPFATATSDGMQRGNNSEDAVQMLNEAAQYMTHADQGNRRSPRASRLSPLRDISADIQRQSTPLLQVSKLPRSKSGNLQGEDLAKRMPDLWPWLQDTDGEEGESDSWSNRTDPLMARHFPNSAEVAQIEEEDLRRAMAEGLVTIPLLPKRTAATGKHRRMQLIFIILVLLAVVAMMMDGGLVFFAFLHQPHPKIAPNGPPSLTLSSNTAKIGQTVILHIHHFSPNSNAYLTHDIQETVQLTSGSALIKVGANGSVDATMLIDSSWTPGFHTIEAEDVTTRYTASATLQITGAGPTRPSHLLIDTSTLDLGVDLQGANTIQSLTLHNSGGGSITWTASSNQPWLLLSPSQGVFSGSQTIAIAGERANLKPGDYKGLITFSSNVGPSEWVQVHMSVRPVPTNAGPVMEVIPPVLSFTALDGAANPVNQVLTINNPGSQRLNWSITGNNQVLTPQALILFAFDPHSNWLSTDQAAGVVVPHGSNTITILVNSQNLLPGVYTSVLVFTGDHGVYNSPQSVSVSLTVQPRCALTLSAGGASFTAVSGQTNPSNQSLTIGATASCSGAINWKAVSANSWLNVTPASGQLKGAANAVTSIGVNATNLKPGVYESNVVFTAAQSTQTVMVQLVVQAPPPPSAPIMGLTTLTLNFSTTQGMPSPPGQVVTITNTGHSQLNWHAQPTQLVSEWLGASPTGGSIAPGQTGQVTVLINTAGLTPNTYVGQVLLSGTDVHGKPASGSPQTVTVNLLVLPPCTLQQPSLSSVAFSVIQGMSNPDPQTVSFTASGNCAWPVNWQTGISRRASSWLQVTPSTGTLATSGQSVSLSVAVNTAGLAVGTYTTNVSINATDSSNTAVQGSPLSFQVTLTIQQPCTLSVTTNNLSFSVAQGQSAPTAQSFGLNVGGTCAQPTTWSVVGNAGSSNWLAISPPTTGTGGGTIEVGVNPQALAPGTYSGKIIVSATGNGGAVVQGSPQIVLVSLTVTGYSLSGMVNACSDANCTTSKPLPGSALTLLNNTTNQSVTATADSLGNYSFANLSMGAYTLTATGSDGTLNYTGTATITVTGNMTSYSLNVYPQ